MESEEAGKKGGGWQLPSLMFQLKSLRMGIFFLLGLCGGCGCKSGGETADGNTWREGEFF